jgi:hypothetical protein
MLAFDRSGRGRGMRADRIETDYLIIGAGAVGLAFADTLLSETDAHITIVDRRGKPGGHWNDAYAFVTLHQPSSFYGVNSTPLGSGRRDTIGLNRGLYELASGAEVVGYFDRVMNQRLLPSGRVSHHPLSNVLEDGSFESLLSGRRTEARVRRKTVDCTYFSPQVPATHTPRFEVGTGVRLVPPNALPGLWQSVERGAPAPRRFVVLGAGKTAMDTCVWLQQCGAPPEAIQWVMPRDSWLINRVGTQSGPEFFFEAVGGQADQLEAFAKATSIADLYLRLEACGALMRIDPQRMPQMFHFATLSPGELEVLRGIRDVVRMGRVQALHTDEVVLQEGRVPVAPGTLFIDCTASAVHFKAGTPVFSDRRITPQLLRAPLVTFSAALTAYVEAHYDDPAHQNRLCSPVPFTHTPEDYPRTMLVALTNQFHWSQDKTLREWIRHSRLDGLAPLVNAVGKDDAEKQAVLARLHGQIGAAAANLPRLVAAAEASAA